MLEVLFVLWGSALAGWCCRRWPQAWVGQLLTGAIWVMLLLIGVEVGSNQLLMQSLARLGWVSLMAALAASVSCSCGALLFFRMVGGEHRKRPGKSFLPRAEKGLGAKAAAVLGKLKDSGIILACFLLGVCAGASGASAYLPAGASLYCLYVLLACAGFSVGQNRDLVQNMRTVKKKMLFLPFVTAIFTWVGMLLVGGLYSDYSLTEWLAVGSGFGYYSLSSILISGVKGAELGTIALLYNVIREILAIVLAPLWLRGFGPLAAISVGGATTADTTLPVIARTSGEGYVPVAIFHGIVMDLSVPVLVPFFCAF